MVPFPFQIPGPRVQLLEYARRLRLPYPTAQAATMPIPARAGRAMDWTRCLDRPCRVAGRTGADETRWRLHTRMAGTRSG